MHWVSAKHAVKSEVRMYDRLFRDENPDGHKDVDFKEFMNPDSLKVIPECYLEPFVKDAQPLDHFQFERDGGGGEEKNGSGQLQEEGRHPLPSQLEMHCVVILIKKSYVMFFV